MRLIHTSLFAAVAALGLSACGQQPADPANTTPATTPADSSAAPAASRRSTVSAWRALTARRGWSDT